MNLKFSVIDQDRFWPYRNNYLNVIKQRLENGMREKMPFLGELRNVERKLGIRIDNICDLQKYIFERAHPGLTDFEYDEIIEISSLLQEAMLDGEVNEIVNIENDYGIEVDTGLETWSYLHRPGIYGIDDPLGSNNLFGDEVENYEKRRDEYRKETAENNAKHPEVIILTVKA